MIYIVFDVFRPFVESILAVLKCVLYTITIASTKLKYFFLIYLFLECLIRIKSMRKLFYAQSKEQRKFRILKSKEGYNNAVFILTW